MKSRYCSKIFKSVDFTFKMKKLLKTVNMNFQN